MFHEREPFVQVAQQFSVRRDKRHHAPEAPFLDDEDFPSDRLLIDPLDDRDSRGALRVRRH
jgi:hypothetical protein